MIGRVIKQNSLVVAWHEVLNCGPFQRSLLLFSRLNCYKCVGDSSSIVALCVNNQWGLDETRSCFKWVFVGGYPGRKICSLHRQMRMEMSRIWCSRLCENKCVIDGCKGWIHFTTDTLEKFTVQLCMLQVMELPGIKLCVWHKGHERTLKTPFSFPPFWNISESKPLCLFTLWNATAHNVCFQPAPSCERPFNFTATDDALASSASLSGSCLMSLLRRTTDENSLPLRPLWSD